MTMHIPRPRLVEAAETELMAPRLISKSVAAARTFSRLCLLGLVLAAGPAAAEVYVEADLSGVTVSSSAGAPISAAYSYAWNEPSVLGYPHALLDGPGEAYVTCDRSARVRYGTVDCPSPKIFARVAEPRELTGSVVLEEHTELRIIRFRIAPQSSVTEPTSGFQRAKLGYFEFLAGKNVAGGAYFRHEAAIARADSAKAKPTQPSPMPWVPPSSGTFEQTLDILSGGRALSENLQLDRALAPTEVAEETVPLQSLKGVDIKAMDWKSRMPATPPVLDPLAVLIPADNYAAFFPSFNAMESLMDEAHQSVGEALRGFESRSEMADSRSRYQSQLCLPLSELAKAVGPYLITELALTGSDPFFRTGTDLALLMSSKTPEVLAAAVRARQDICKNAAQNAISSDGKLNGLPFHAVTTDDRSISSYAATINGTVVVTNSRLELERIAEIAASGASSLQTLDEYRFFRSRYKRGDEDEAALIVLPDAAIRKWVGPQWRIAESRRTRAAAFLADLQMAHAGEILGSSAGEKRVSGADIPSGLGAVTIGQAGVRSAVYGTTGFLTPISELTVSNVSVKEKEAYERFRQTYSMYWKTFFDPIAIRITKSKTALGVDATIMPLILGTDYDFLRTLTSHATIDELSGDPHDDALAEFTFAIDSSTPVFMQRTMWLGMWLPGVTNPLGWIGRSVSVFLDPGPFWKLIAEANDPEREIEHLYAQLPVGFFIEVRDSLKLTAFLSALRTMAEQGAPGLSRWENLVYHGVTYVKVSESNLPTGNSVRAQDRPHWALYYAATPEALIITLDEKLLQRSLDRLGHRGEKRDSPALQFGKGSQIRALLHHDIVDAVQIFYRRKYREIVRDRCWSNIPILNEWRRRYPELDPLEVQRRLLNTTVVCQAGGTYRWNADDHTMESSVFGHPGAYHAVQHTVPFLAGADAVRFALGFESDGLRAQLRLERSGTAPANEIEPPPSPVSTAAPSPESETSN